ncbi:MAG: hypothetical protein QGG36_27535 [Pirellulaceae bacterium]|nr:hypothetical protein [Pirellulaceae bacterium]
MTRQQRLLMRMAIAIHEQLHSKTAHDKCVGLPTAAWEQCESRNRKLQKATQRGWNLAANRLIQDLRLAVERLCKEIAELDHKLRPSGGEGRKASVADIYADLVAMHDEFEDVVFNRRDHTLSVTTEAIELDGVYLGPFEIRLDWTDLLEGHPSNYRVIAVDPNPAAANESVTHPHVQDEAVCEGDGHQPIRNAMEQGRLLDFFMIVANLLRTYNSGSPFVSLSDWHGVECADCGSTVCDDERWTCEKCETTVCGECYYNCPGCDGIFCNECMTRCEGCDENHCSGCMKQCSGCDAELCQGCLNDNERCSDCHDQELEEEAKEMEGDGSGHRDDDAGAPLQPNGLGQVAVPA